MDKLNGNIPNRQLLKLREILSKIVIEKYFPDEDCALYDVDTLSYDSIRGKTIRKLLKFLQKRNPQRDKENDKINCLWTRRLVLECEKIVKSRNRSSSEYMREMVSLLT